MQSFPSDRPDCLRHGSMLFTVTLMVMLVTGGPFMMGAPVVWSHARIPLLAGTGAMALLTWFTLGCHYGRQAAWIFGITACVIAWGAEAGCLAFGWYRYHPDIRPVLPGGVPLFIPLAWFVLCGIPVMLLRDLRITHPSGKIRKDRLLRKAMFCAVCVVACDVALEPVALAVRAWTWSAPGIYFGAPLMNFAMWGLVGLLICFAGLAVLAKSENTRAECALDFDCVWSGFHLCLLIMLVVAHQQRVGYCAPLCVAMAMTLPFGWYWYRNLGRRWRTRRRSRHAGG